MFLAHRKLLTCRFEFRMRDGTISLADSLNQRLDRRNKTYILQNEGPQIAVDLS